MKPKNVLDFLPQLEKALSYTGTHTVHDVKDQIEAGRAQLWVEGDGLVITQVDLVPRGKVLRFWLAAGKLEDVLTLAEALYQWGRDIGCHKAVFTGRRGWAKPLAAHDWTEARELRLYTKDL